MNDETSGLILEKIDSIERRLLEMEKETGEGIDPHVAVHLLFRDMHNLKSSLSMQGADISAKLVHQGESCLDALRSGKGDSESDWVDLLLSLSDHVKKSVENDEERASPSLSEQFDTLLAKWLHHESTQTREITFPLEPEEAQKLKKAVSSGSLIYTLEKLVGEELSDSEVKTLPVFDAIEEAGSLIAIRLAHVPGSLSILTLIFASVIPREELSYILFDPFYPVTWSQSASLRNETKKPVKDKTEELPRILIVEDEIISIMLLQNFLSPYGRIDTAQNGNEALDKFTLAFNSKDPYHVVFLDIMIPGITGNTVLAEIRKLENTVLISPGYGTRIVMASSMGDYSSISTSFQNQGDAYLIKPIDSQMIDKTMTKLGFSKIKFPFSVVPKSTR